jgi:hypothetical protein
MEIDAYLGVTPGGFATSGELAQELGIPPNAAKAFETRLERLAGNGLHVAHLAAPGEVDTDASIPAQTTQKVVRCSVSFVHQPHDLCDGYQPAAQTTHGLLDDAARLLEGHGCKTTASDVLDCKGMVPNVPLAPDAGEGMVMVPVEPTVEMVEAGRAAMAQQDPRSVSHARVLWVWKDMLKAASK